MGEAMSLDAMKLALDALEHEAQVGNDDAYRVEREALRAAIEQAQEPVAWMTFNAVGDEDDIWYVNPDGKLLEGWTYKPLYTAPRQWKSLTDDEMNALVSRFARYELARAIEAKLKEKNT